MSSPFPCAMLNRAPDKWREWRLGNQVLSLYLPDPKAPPPPVEQKPLCEVSHMCIKALKDKGELPSLAAAIEGLNKAPDSPGGRVREERFRDTLKTVVLAVLTPDEVEDIFPTSESKPPSRSPSKSSRRPSKMGA
uniref:Uncharacterized protein n=1 Tax=Spumella elongata TaxID=89044 RepID=A0A7S3HKL2_9STRA